MSAFGEHSERAERPTSGAKRTYTASPPVLCGGSRSRPNVPWPATARWMSPRTSRRRIEPGSKRKVSCQCRAAQEILTEARMLITEERFLNWQVAFPGVWSDWEEDGLTGGFDAIVGNPPWDRMKLHRMARGAAQRHCVSAACLGSSTADKGIG